MWVYIILFFVSFLFSLVVTPLLRRMAIKNGALDYPNERKLHKEALPRVGGIGIAISFLIIMVLGCSLLLSGLRGSMLYLTGLSVGVGIVTVIGVWDDLRGLKARKKLIGQAIAVLAMVPFGFVIRKFNIPFVGNVEIGWELGIPLTIFWVAGIVNTINFIDGVDGLAAGTSVIIASALFIISAVTRQMLMMMICLILAGSTLGFLRYNFHPATIFMGDCGAMFLGFMLAATSVEILFHNPSITASSLVPVLVFGLPVVDTSWSIVRRLMKRQSPFRADSLHIHHRLISLGFTQNQVVIILYAVSALSVASGLVVALAGSEILAVALSAFMLVLALAGIGILSRVSPASDPLENAPARLDKSPHPVVERSLSKNQT